jgi:hypothetical protein
MHTPVNRFKHLPRWSWEIENKEKFRGSSYWPNAAAQQVRRTCVLRRRIIQVAQCAKVDSGFFLVASSIAL